MSQVLPFPGIKSFKKEKNIFAVPKTNNKNKKNEERERKNIMLGKKYELKEGVVIVREREHGL